MKRPFTVLVFSSCLVAGVLSLHACSDAQETPPPPRPVKLMTVGSAAVGPTIELAGEVRARVESRLGFRVAGKIIARSVEAGQRVKRGQVLARIDPRDYQLALQAAQSNRAAAEQELSRARSDLDRFESLKQQGYVSAAELDRARTVLAAATAAHEQATSLLGLEENRHADTMLRADADGVIVSVHTDVGEVVEIGVPVMVLAHDGAREIAVEFAEDRSALARVASAEAYLWADPTQRFPATLRELSASADPVTRTFRARYSVKAARGALALGQSATLVLKVPADPRVSAGIIRLPSTALVGDHGASMVWVFDPEASAVKRQPVQVAGLDGNDVLVAGLADGAQVVIAGTHKLAEGQRVRPLTATTSGAPATPTATH